MISASSKKKKIYTALKTIRKCRKIIFLRTGTTFYNAFGFQKIMKVSEVFMLCNGVATKWSRPKLSCTVSFRLMKSHPFQFHLIPFLPVLPVQSYYILSNPVSCPLREACSNWKTENLIHFLSRFHLLSFHNL